MPPKKRRAIRGRNQYTVLQIRQLLTGHEFVWGAGFGSGDNLDRDAVAEAWEELRDELLPAYILEHPGRRPWAWWEVESPEPRRCIEGPGAHAFRNPNAPAWTKRLSFGKPTCWGGDDFANPSRYESQPAYLDRHGLLDDAERLALAASPHVSTDDEEL